MKLLRRRFLQLAAAAAASPALPQFASALDYPTRPITMVVPFSAGGPMDTIARFMAQRMRPSLGQPIIIENVSGAGGSLGVGRVARAAPDGYTLVSGMWSTHVVNGAVYTLQYDVLNDFEPIALLTDSSQLIVAKRTVPADDLKGLIAWLSAAHLRRSFPERHRHAFSVRALSRWRAGHAGFGGRSDRYDDYRSGHLVAADARRQSQSLCVHG
jgi:tripartite-type tricarboxylate transporter receptor subunit TctC